MTRRISILGATGSIGDSTLDLIRRAPKGAFQIVALTANHNAPKLAQLAKEFNAEFVALGSSTHKDALTEALSDTSIEFGVGEGALIEAAARPADFTMAAIMGAAGLAPTLEAVKQGRHIGLANKECLVCAGDLFSQAVKASEATLLPVDSEHNAIFQVLDCEQPQSVKRLILTASGGPFRGKTRSELKSVTPKDALNHPIWSMGAKISIDSATLMNKGLELIEASYLFDRPSSEIDVVVHPQSVVHSMVEYIDGSVLSQMGSPDMRTPIAYALAWPERMHAPVTPLDFLTMGALSFEAPDIETFSGLRLAREALESGGSAPNIFNASNEIAVAAFLDEQIGFLDIAEIVARTLDTHHADQSVAITPQDPAQVLEIDGQARATAIKLIERL